MGVLLSLRYFKRLTPLVLSGILPFFGLFGVFPVAPKLFQAGVERIAGNAEEFAHPFAALGNQKRAVGIQVLQKLIAVRLVHERGRFAHQPLPFLEEMLQQLLDIRRECSWSVKKQGENFGSGYR